MVELIPELKLISGEQPDAPDLPPQQARRLFQVALRRLIGVFATRTILSRSSSTISNGSTQQRSTFSKI